MTEPPPIPSELDVIGRAIVNGADKIHTALGPGMRESVYHPCLRHEIVKAGFRVEEQVPVSVTCDGSRFDKAVIEIKAVEKLLPVHEAQLLTYLRLSGKRLGALINFNVAVIKDGIRRRAL